MMIKHEVSEQDETQMRRRLSVYFLAQTVSATPAIRYLGKQV